jgi:hypothetical protein
VFRPLQHREVRAVRRWKDEGPPGLVKEWNPVDFFKLMWTDGELQLIARSTNAYAKAHRAGEPHHREWKDTSAGEIQVWLGLVVYMGVWGQRGGYEQYWTQVSVGGRCLKVSADKPYRIRPSRSMLS